MIFTTESGSAYEVDTIKRRVRRLRGVTDPTPRQGKDGEWRAFKGMSAVAPGRSVVFSWDPETTPLLPGSDSGSLPATVTSPVKEIFT